MSSKASRRSSRVASAEAVASATAWAYCVVSSDGQSDTLPHQLAWAESVAAANRWRLTNTISGVSSGKHGARNAYQGMLAELRALAPEKRPEWVLMIRLDRVGRGDNLAHVQVALSDLYDLGCKVYTREDGEVQMESAMQQVIAAIKLAVAQQENSVRTDKLLNSYDRRRKLRATDPTVAVSCRPPYGLAYENGKLVAKEPEDGAVRRAYELRLQGYGFHRIGQVLATEAPPLSRKNGKIEYQKWNGDRVSRLIRQEMYREVLVDAQTWFRAQQNARSYNMPKRKLDWPLGGGVLKCECGTPLVGLTGGQHKGSGKKRAYYHCRDVRRAHGTTVKAKAVVHQKEVLEAQFVTLLHELAASPDVTALYATRAGAPDEDERELRKRALVLRSEIGSLESRRDRLFAALEDGAMDSADFGQRLAHLKRRAVEAQLALDAAEVDIAAMRARVRSVAEARQLVAIAAQTWPLATTLEQQALARTLGEALGGFVVTVDHQLRCVIATTPGIEAGAAR